MAEFPALPLWTDAYLADTRHLSTLEHGAYLLLLMEAWRRPHTSLPDDDELLARLAGMVADEWHMHKSKIMSFWRLESRTKTWVQKRLTDEKSYVAKTSRKQRSNAKARWNKDKEVSPGNANGHATAMPDECQTDAPTPTPTPTPKEGIGARLKEVVEAWNSMASQSGLPAIKTLTEQRRRTLKIRIDEAGGVDAFLAIMAKVGRSPFLTGHNDRSWRADFDFILQQSSFVKLMEGRYDEAERVLTKQQMTEWEERMAWGRKNQQWHTDKWGPRPGEAGCEVPASLVQADDGADWTEWKGAGR